MKDEARQLYRQVFQTFSELTTLIEKSQTIVQGAISLEELADYAYATKMAAELVHEVRKKIDGLLENEKRIICMRVTVSNSTDAIKTEYTTATPKIAVMPTLPNRRKDMEGYIAFMKHFGFSDELINNDSFRPHWPGMKAQIEEDLELGKPMPPGCDPSRTYPVYDVVLRRKKGVLE